MIPREKKGRKRGREEEEKEGMEEGREGGEQSDNLKSMPTGLTRTSACVSAFRKESNQMLQL